MGDVRICTEKMRLSQGDGALSATRARERKIVRKEAKKGFLIAFAGICNLGEMRVPFNPWQMKTHHVVAPPQTPMNVVVGPAS